MGAGIRPVFIEAAETTVWKTAGGPSRTCREVPHFSEGGGMMDFAPYIATVARKLYGNPNQKLSTSSQLRFGTNGSLAVEIGGKAAGTWYDHETKAGGGVLDLGRQKRGLANGTAARLGVRVQEGTFRFVDR